MYFSIGIILFKEIDVLQLKILLLENCVIHFRTLNLNSESFLLMLIKSFK